MKMTTWACDKAMALRPQSGAEPGLAVQQLVDALAALKGTAGRLVFGLAPESIEPAGRAQVTEAAERALLEWRQHFADARDAVALLTLAQASKLVHLPQLQVTERFPLRCDPLGDASKLDKAWKARLERLKAAKAGSGRLQVQAIGMEPEDARPMEVFFGEPDPAALYAFALQFETSRDEMFPRELAAWWSVADGIRIHDTWVLEPVKAWDWEDAKTLRLGTGSSAQGSLSVGPVSLLKNLLKAALVDRDDDGAVLQRYKNLGEFLDLLLPG